mgnify:CR=1 FL=1
MRRLLTTTTALSIALAPVNPWPLMAQTLTETGAIVAEDGTVLCEPTAEAPCFLENYGPEGLLVPEPADGVISETAPSEAEASAAAEAEAAAAAADPSASDPLVSYRMLTPPRSCSDTDPPPEGGATVGGWGAGRGAWRAPGEAAAALPRAGPWTTG